MDDKYIFETTDLHLACYLKAEGVEFKQITCDVNSDKCKFIFTRDENTMSLVSSWYSSETDYLRKLLQVNTELKYQLKQQLWKKIQSRQVK